MCLSANRRHLLLLAPSTSSFRIDCSEYVRASLHGAFLLVVFGRTTRHQTHNTTPDAQHDTTLSLDPLRATHLVLRRWLVEAVAKLSCNERTFGDPFCSLSQNLLGDDTIPACPSNRLVLRELDCCRKLRFCRESLKSIQFSAYRIANSPLCHMSS